MPHQRFILLDRDGVLNESIISPDGGPELSPFGTAQVVIKPGVAHALARLTAARFGLAIVTNQPGAAKGMATLEAIRQTHAHVVDMIQRDGAVIASSHLCLHAQGEGCSCRKPEPGLLLDAMRQHGWTDPAKGWMVGDRVTDVQAGVRAGVQTALLRPRDVTTATRLEALGCQPDFWGPGLVDFVVYLLGEE